VSRQAVHDQFASHAFRAFSHVLQARTVVSTALAVPGKSVTVIENAELHFSLLVNEVEMHIGRVRVLEDIRQRLSSDSQ
jgi:hypothetical protein